MFVIALLSNFLIGFGAKKSATLMFLIVPLAVSISFLLIADIDSPQGGLIRVHPQNLDILARLAAAQIALFPFLIDYPCKAVPGRLR